MCRRSLQRRWRRAGGVQRSAGLICRHRLGTVSAAHGALIRGSCLACWVLTPPGIMACYERGLVEAHWSLPVGTHWGGRCRRQHPQNKLLSCRNGAGAPRLLVSHPDAATLASLSVRLSAGGAPHIAVQAAAQHPAALVQAARAAGVDNLRDFVFLTSLVSLFYSCSGTAAWVQAMFTILCRSLPHGTARGCLLYGPPGACQPHALVPSWFSKRSAAVALLSVPQGDACRDAGNVTSLHAWAALASVHGIVTLDSFAGRPANHGSSGSSSSSGVRALQSLPWPPPRRQ